MPVRWNAEVMDLQGMILKTTFFLILSFLKKIIWINGAKNLRNYRKCL